MKRILGSVLVIVTGVYLASGQTTEFSYQGSLRDGVNQANGNYDFEFRLFDALTNGNQIGSLQTRSTVAVAAGGFAVNLNFGAAFPGADRFLEIRVRSAGGGAFTLLEPRHRITSSPYAVKALVAETAVGATSAATATNALQLGGVAANQYVVTTDPRMTNARAPTSGSPSYIQNGSALQSTSNFNVSGTGEAEILSARTELRLAGFRALSVIGTDNLFAGILAGENSVGSQNTFIGRDAGRTHTSGSENTFVGARAGGSSTNNFRNVFVGMEAGRNAAGTQNVFVGNNAGYNNTSIDNAFFGNAAGFANTSGGNNSFLGSSAGNTNTTGAMNTFVGYAAGGNTTGSNNTLLGSLARVVPSDLTYATAVGSGVIVNNSNSVVLGRAEDAVRIPGNLQLITLASGGGTQICRNGLTNFLATCSSSLRYKTNLAPFNSGLDLIGLLKPITFDWKNTGTHDLGLGAEDVAAIEPLLVTYNKDGQVEGVKYDRIGVVMINAIKEQQATIERQQAEIDQLKRKVVLIDSLKELICGQTPHAGLCQEEK